ncbi:hypothetical protein GCM10023170_082910 [Phytohabitans houttuyneae]|uniref:Uncharacterized protein n=2 Tax=Phytohabitans houttuyneae TaxID=1076126 RepID=A0A6V8KLW0_9ACTN|nr:hypothetical protein Phou_075910 [Phytohabitans houttuyneae]
MICPEPQGLALERHLRRAVGRDRVARLQAAIPFNGGDFALFLDRVPGTFSFLGVRRPGGTIESGYPHLGTFDPDERRRSRGPGDAGWLASSAAG